MNSLLYQQSLLARLPTLELAAALPCTACGARSRSNASSCSYTEHAPSQKHRSDRIALQVAVAAALVLAAVMALLAASLPSLHQLMASSPACLLSLRRTSEVLPLHDHLLYSLLQGFLVSFLDSELCCITCMACLCCQVAIQCCTASKPLELPAQQKSSAVQADEICSQQSGL